MKKLRSFEQINEELKPGYETKEIMSMLKPIMDEEYDVIMKMIK